VILWCTRASIDAFLRVLGLNNRAPWILHSSDSSSCGHLISLLLFLLTLKQLSSKTYACYHCPTIMIAICRESPDRLLCVFIHIHTYYIATSLVGEITTFIMDFPRKLWSLGGLCRAVTTFDILHTNVCHLMTMYRIISGLTFQVS